MKKERKKAFVNSNDFDNDDQYLFIFDILPL